MGHNTGDKEIIKIVHTDATMSYVASRTLHGQTTLKADLDRAHQSTDVAIITLQSYWPTGQMLANHGSTFKSPRLFHAVLANHRTKVSRENRYWDEFEFYTETINAIMTWLSALPFDHLWCDDATSNNNNVNLNCNKNGNQMSLNKKRPTTIIDSFSGKYMDPNFQNVPVWLTAYSHLMNSVYYLGAEQALCNVFNSVICFTRVESLKFANYSFAGEAVFRSYRLSYPAFRNERDDVKKTTRNTPKNFAEENGNVETSRARGGKFNDGVSDVMKVQKILSTADTDDDGGKNLNKQIKSYATNEDDVINDDEVDNEAWNSGDRKKFRLDDHQFKLAFKEEIDENVHSDDDYGWRWKVKPHYSFFPNLYECRLEILSAVDYVAGRVDPSLCEDAQKNETRITELESVIAGEIEKIGERMMREKLANVEIERRVKKHETQTSTIIIMVAALFSYLIAVHTIKIVFLLKKHLRDKSTHRKKKKKQALATTSSAAAAAATTTAASISTPTSTISTFVPTPITTFSVTSTKNVNSNAISNCSFSPVVSPNLMKSILTTNSTMPQCKKCCNVIDSTTTSSTLHNKQRKGCCAFVIDTSTNIPTLGNLNSNIKNINENQNMQCLQQPHQHSQNQHQNFQTLQQQSWPQNPHLPHQQQQQQQPQRQQPQRQQLLQQQQQQQQIFQLHHQQQQFFNYQQSESINDINLSPNVANTLHQNIQQTSTLLPKKGSVSQSYKCNNYISNPCGTLGRNTLLGSTNNNNNNNYNNNDINNITTNNNKTLLSPVSTTKLSTISLFCPPPNTLNNSGSFKMNNKMNNSSSNLNDTNNTNIPNNTNFLNNANTINNNISGLMFSNSSNSVLLNDNSVACTEQVTVSSKSILASNKSCVTNIGASSNTSNANFSNVFKQ
ncbi:hypothetical protein HELRODRAFT_167383 [Helobdella robusta]|uniref:Uncharacterized protein n=1 Tax=Helobdella robusta TaxID=6412 RepID=T1EZB6_HELRO|nr:hypothetical protein HELRODRAFT_167383 [Helobdella robusta]ESO10871.1 hypothetical protein HELRODRAFT_167383 [Helobdella robusta]